MATQSLFVPALLFLPDANKPFRREDKGKETVNERKNSIENYLTDLLEDKFKVSQ